MTSNTQIHDTEEYNYNVLAFNLNLTKYAGYGCNMVDALGLDFV